MDFPVGLYWRSFPGDQSVMGKKGRLKNVRHRNQGNRHGMRLGPFIQNVRHVEMSRWEMGEPLENQLSAKNWHTGVSVSRVDHVFGKFL